MARTPKPCDPVRGTVVGRYPHELERYARTTDGIVYHVRPIRPDDADTLVRFHSLLSERSTYLRYFGSHPRLSADEVQRFTHVDYHDRLALVAEREGEFLGVGRFDRLGGSEAEVAFVVADAYHHRGIATCLLDELVQAALARDITTFEAEVLTENGDMFNMLLGAGLPMSSERHDDVTTVTFPIWPTSLYVKSLMEREVRRHVGIGRSPHERYREVLRPVVTPTLTDRSS